MFTPCYRCLCAARFNWQSDDPEIVSDVLFAVANVMSNEEFSCRWRTVMDCRVMSIARTTYLMPAFEVLGPLQISLGRMIGDITRFLVLFTLVGSRSNHTLSSLVLQHNAQRSNSQIVTVNACLGLFRCCLLSWLDCTTYTGTTGHARHDSSSDPYSAGYNGSREGLFTSDSLATLALHKFVTYLTAGRPTVTMHSGTTGHRLTRRNRQRNSFTRRKPFKG